MPGLRADAWRAGGIPMAPGRGNGSRCPAPSNDGMKSLVGRGVRQELGKSWSGLSNRETARIPSDQLLCPSRGQDLNLRPLGYEPSELPDCSTPQSDASKAPGRRQPIGAAELRQAALRLVRDGVVAAAEPRDEDPGGVRADRE